MTLQDRILRIAKSVKQAAGGMSPSAKKALTGILKDLKRLGMTPHATNPSSNLLHILQGDIDPKDVEKVYKKYGLNTTFKIGPTTAFHSDEVSGRTIGTDPVVAEFGWRDM